MREVKEIIGNESAEELRNEVWDMLGSADTTYEDIEDLFMGYGLEMDYFEQMFC